MTITIRKLHLAIAVLAVALIAPATAFAAHVFTDVPDDAFYADPVEWAFDNEITTGKSPTQFAPLDPVTRGESVTFLKRYNDNLVQPGLAALQAEVEATDAATATNGADIATNASGIAANAAAIPVQLWAVVGGDGTLARSNDPQTISGRTRTGRYEVHFGTDVSECSYTATAGDIGEGHETERIVTVASLPNGVFIETTDTGGGAIDADFHLQVMC